MERIYAALGGRKQTNGLIAVAILTVAYFTHDVGFLEFAGTILLALGITTAGHAAVDRVEARGRVAEAAAEGARGIQEVTEQLQETRDAIGAAGRADTAAEDLDGEAARYEGGLR